MNSEVACLDISPEQWLELLVHRNTSKVLTLVKDMNSNICELTTGGVLDSFWQCFYRLFLPDVKPSEDRMNQLVYGPIVHHNNVEQVGNL